MQVKDNLNDVKIAYRIPEQRKTSFLLYVKYRTLSSFIAVI